MALAPCRLGMLTRQEESLSCQLRRPRRNLGFCRHLSRSTSGRHSLGHDDDDVVVDDDDDDDDHAGGDDGGQASPFLYIQTPDQPPLWRRYW